jgi:methionyl-tRNA formyltransferase
MDPTADAPSDERADRVRTVFLGSGRFAQPILGRLAAHPSVEVVGVVTAPPRPVGRRGIRTPTPVETTARELGLGVMTPERLRDLAAIADILGLEPTLLVLADYGQIVPDELLEAPDGALNLHPSLLPRHRGATPIPAAILAGDAETGVTLMRMDAGLDTGPVVAQTRVPLTGDETTPLLEETLEVEAAELLTRYLGPWLRGKITATPQPEDGASMTRPLRREDGRLDPARSGAELERQVRAYQPWPGSFVDTDAGRLIVWRAEFEDEGPPPGVFDEGGIGTGDGSRLRLREVQPAGRDRMSWDAYLRGRPAIAGSSIVR